LLVRKGLESYTLYKEQADLPVEEFLCDLASAFVSVRMNYSPAFEATLKSFSYVPMFITHIMRGEDDSRVAMNS